jgi:hypothetical protein
MRTYINKNKFTLLLDINRVKTLINPNDTFTTDIQFFISGLEEKVEKIIQPVEEIKYKSKKYDKPTETL